MTLELRPIGKLLIANRGEIAVRIARTCRAMGIVSVAVYSDADRDALHVRSCDEAYHIGPAAASESYLRGDKIIAVATEAQCDAIHPGYGFLSENAAFAQAVIAAGLTWVGPDPDAIRLMGSKIESKRLAEANGVPIVPGYFGVDHAPESLAAQAEAIGYPVLIKASAGGGGKGMRVVERRDDFAEALEGATREAQAAFGDPSVMLEKYLTRPRHIEVQVIGDNYGNLIHLGERECSIQRRHQKVLEESPSPALTAELRDAITASALVLARAAGYSNAGTVEFIFEEGYYYFLEMNTRLQVEHPVTEEALGLDLVEMQIRLASGEKLGIEQNDVRFSAHAIEARLYAEDPSKGFVPSTGTVSLFDLPPQFTNTRVDSGIETGDAVSPFYDPMIGKIITHGKDRATAVTRMQSALGALRIEGVTTNVAFLRWLANHPVFMSGELSTRFIEEYYEAGAIHSAPVDIVVAAVNAFGTGDSIEAASYEDVWSSSPWRQAGLARPLNLTIEGIEFSAEVSRGNSRAEERILLSRSELVLYDGPLNSSFGSRGAEVRLVPSSSVRDTAASAQIEQDGRVYVARLTPALSTERMTVAIVEQNQDNLESPMPGTVLKINVNAGDQVREGQALAVVEAMKMEFTIRAPHEGRIRAVHPSPGSQVAAGDVLIEMFKPGEEQPA